MNPETIQAIQDSIAHWERMRDEPMCGEGPYSLDCPLCLMFYGQDDSGENCGKCPVRKKTAKNACIDTPYPDARDAWKIKETEPELWRRQATLEIEFLKSLLPKEERS